jgi:hypothetical protein
MSIRRRVEKLKQELGRGQPCPECGHLDGKPATDTIDFEVVWIYDKTDHEGPEFCPACGQQLVYVVSWGPREKSVSTPMSRTAG